MRLIHRKVLLALVAVALVSSFALAPGVAGAAKHKSKGPTTAALNKKLKKLTATVNKIAKNLKDVTGTVNGGIPIITQLVDKLTQAGAGLTALQAGLTTVGNGLTALSAAVQNTTTGLPGLNAARSLVGAVVSNTAATGSEFTVAHPSPGSYILSFKDGAGNAADVSKRSIMVTPFPTGGAPVIASAVGCSAPGTPCTGADTKATDVLVLLQATSAAPTDGNFQVAAISG